MLTMPEPESLQALEQCLSQGAVHGQEGVVGLTAQSGPVHKAALHVQQAGVILALVHVVLDPVQDVLLGPVDWIHLLPGTCEEQKKHSV